MLLRFYDFAQRGAVLGVMLLSGFVGANMAATFRREIPILSDRRAGQRLAAARTDAETATASVQAAAAATAAAAAAAKSSQTPAAAGPASLPPPPQGAMHR